MLKIELGQTTLSLLSLLSLSLTTSLTDSVEGPVPDAHPQPSPWSRGGGVSLSRYLGMREASAQRPRGAQLTRKLPAHLRYAPLSAETPSEAKQSPSALAAELKGLAQPAAVLRRPRVVGLLNMSEFTHNVDSVVALEEPLFQPSPPEIVFDSFEPHGKYAMVLRFRNNDKVNRRLKVLDIDSTVFTVEPPKSAANGSSKVAPGMEVAYKITFTPRAVEDYACDLICLSEREKFIVSISARGPRPCFEFPDGVDFGLQPVRANATEAFLLRNTGVSEGRFVLSVPAPFSVTPSDGALQAGDALQLTFGFQPLSRGEYAEELLIEYSTGERCYARLSGASSDVEVGFERSLLVLEPCYISLLSQTTLKLHNRSDVKVQFAWRAHRSTLEDEARRTDAMLHLDRDAGSMSAHGMRAARRQIDEDPLPFDDPIFSIEPASGEIFPNSFCELTVAFRPKTAGEAAITAYCELTGREARLPLQLQGQGLGPKATWLYESLDIGDVYVNSEHRYEVVLENHGDIDCDYSLAPNDSLFASCFVFTPSQGHLNSREQQVVTVNFCSDLLGEVNESFIWYLEGQPEPLPLLLKGRVIGPQFHFSLPDGVNFGTVSLGFLKSTPFFLHNAAEIPMRFRLRIPDHNGAEHPEFEIMPSSGIILPHGKQEIRLDFISTAVQSYQLAMMVDVEAVGDSLLSLPISAECVVPPIHPSTYEVDFGDAFVGHTYEQTIEIVNPSHLPAKCEVVAAQPMLNTIGKYVAEPPRSIVPAGEAITVKIKFTAAQLGQMCLPMYVRIVGVAQPAFTVELSANAIGPNVLFSSNKIDWGKAQVLTNISRPITMTNDSLVAAEYSAFLRKGDSPFQIKESTGTLAPGEHRDLVLSCHMDDTVKSTNELIVQIVNAPEQIIALAATGIGATITASRNLKVIDMGENFSSRIIKDEFALENLGRKPQQVSWMNAPTAATKERGPREGDEKLQQAPVFTISPEKVLMEPGAVCTFTVRGMSTSAGLCEEILTCLAQVGTAKAIPIFETAVRSTFVEPLISTSTPQLEFLYTYTDGDCKKTLPRQSKTLRLTNVSPLPLTLVLKCAPPFAVNTAELHLVPSHSADVLVEFDVSYPGDMVSRTYADASTKLFIAYREHPQKDSVRLFAETQFPNMMMTPCEGAFGCLLNDTQGTLTMTLSNTSSVDAHYSWSFAPNEDQSCEDPVAFFDILPIRGMLAAGTQETVEVTYRGTSHGKLAALALCHVVGGPTYSFPLTAESSAVSWKLDRNRLDFGPQNYDRVEERDLLLSNTGRVAFTYSADKSKLSRKNVVEILPPTGCIQAGEKQRIIVRVLPGLPEQLSETFYLQIAHFPPEKVVVTVEGMYPRITLNLPRDKTADNYAIFQAKAKEKLETEKAAVEKERLGVPSFEAHLPCPHLDTVDLCRALARSRGTVKEVLTSWGRVHAESFLSREEFRTLALVVLGPACSPAAANEAFAALTQEGVEEADLGAVSSAPSMIAPLRLAVLSKAIQAYGGSGGMLSRIASAEASSEDVDEDLCAVSTRTPLPTTAQEALDSSTGRPKAQSNKAGDVRSSASDPSGRYRIFVDNDVDYEAERLTLSAYAKQVLETHGDLANESPPPTARSTGTALQAKVPRGTTATPATRRLVPLLEPLPPPTPGFTVAKYILDFGNVIKGMQRKKIFRLKNVGCQAVSLDIDKNTLTSVGLRVEPDKVVKLPGLPEPETTEFTVTFATKAPKVQLGAFKQELRLDLKPGPPVSVMIYANVTLPELRLSDEQIDFGNVIVGRCQTHTVLLHNPKEVPAEWSVKAPLGGTKDFNHFVCFPNSGTLAPGGRVYVEVTFTPGVERPYQTQLSFKPSVPGAKATSLHVFGHGKELRCLCIPDACELPPVMPHSLASSVTFELKNPTAYPIEVYCVDFDDAFMHEETLLREDTSAPTLPQVDALILHPREPGEEFWPSLREAHEAHKRDMEAEAELGGEADESCEGKGGEIPAPDISPVGVLQEKQEAEAESKQRTLMVISAAPMVDSAGLAKRLASSYQVPVVDLGKLMTTAAKEQAVNDVEDSSIPAAENADVSAEPAQSKSEPEDLLIENDTLSFTLDDEATAAAVASAVSHDANPEGCIVLMPEMPVVACATPSLIRALATCLEGEPTYTFIVDLPRDEIEARADVELAASVAEMPPVGDLPDMEESEYDALDETQRASFEATRRDHRRNIAVREARVKAQGIAHRHRVDMLLQEHGEFTARMEEMASLFAASVDPASTDDMSTPLPGVWTLDLANDELVHVDEPNEEVESPPALHAASPAPNTPRSSLERLAKLCEAHLPKMPPAQIEVEPEPDIPRPYTRQIIKRPRPRAMQHRRAHLGLELITLPALSQTNTHEVEHDGSEESEVPTADLPAEDMVNELADQKLPTQQTRWVLQPYSHAQLQVNFSSPNVGKLLHSLRFEMVGVGADRHASVACAALCTRPSISTDPRNVFSRKVKSREPLRVKKSYVVMRKCFEFGPLLTKRPLPSKNVDERQEVERPHADHTEMLHISNNSPFPLTVNFSFLADGVALHTAQPRPFSPPQHLESPGLDNEAESPVTQSPAAEVLERSPGSPAVFFLDTSSMTLQPSETRDLRLSAFPDMDGLFEDNLVCTVSSNPEPVQFPISCIGSTPAVALDNSEVVFQRMLMGQRDTKVLTISSRSALPVRWAIRPEDLLAIAGGEEGGPDDTFYTITPTSGNLAPGEVAYVSITFSAKQAGECSKQFHIEVTDDNDPAVLGIADRHVVQLSAEAYDIQVSIEWPERDGDGGYKGLNFKSFKVVDKQTIPGEASAGYLELVNEGKYEVAFKFLFKSKQMKSILNLDPSEGILPPAANGEPTRTKVEVTLKAERELSLRDNTDVRLRITEPLTGEDFLTVPIPVSAHAVFSKYVTVPRGINFGPMVYDTQKERTFELTNTGDFEFSFALNHRGAEATLASNAPSIACGRFTITPQSGTVPAGGTAIITVKFSASPDARAEHEILVIDVADRDASKEPDGTMYELIAESCIPGIETNDVVNIFEEQTVNRTMTLAAAGLPSNVFAEDEKLFSFGSHMVGHEVSERFKLTNPFKVPCTVDVQIAARATKAGGKDAIDPGTAPFDIEPKKLTIPPHEHRYVTCYFSPISMQTYFATLEANVELGTVPSTKQLSFDLMAEGTLPHVVVTRPVTRSEDGSPLLQFPKLLVGRTLRQKLTLRNEGVLPATVSISQPSVPGSFSCVLCGQCISLPSMGEQSVDVVFKPLSAGTSESVITISVHHNEFEIFTLVLHGEGHLQQVALEDLPPQPEAPGTVDVSDSAAGATDAEDKLIFGDVQVGVPKTLTFTLRNFSETTRRFAWRSVPSVTFSPSVGHLPPNGAKAISATFTCTEPLEYEAEEAGLELQKIKYTDVVKLNDWDDSMTVVKYLTEEEYEEHEARVAADDAAPPAGEQSSDAEAFATLPDTLPHLVRTGTAPRSRRKVVEVEPEPVHEVVPCEEGDAAEGPLPLIISAKCHYASVQCEASALSFKPTMMFQVRQHTFHMANTSGVALHYRWKVAMPDGGQEVMATAEAPFSASPTAGVVPPQGRVEVTVSFSPPEADTFHRKLLLLCDNLAPDVVAPSILLTGKSMRPYCHFEVSESDYVRAGRRSPDMPGPDGSLGPLDPSTKVIEFNSLGTRVRNTKRFYVINPTNRTYEFGWVPATEETAGTQELVAQPFRCQTRKGTILAGRKYEMVFHFTPDVVTLQESHWRFQVADLGIDVPFLLVGTILEPGVSLDRTRHNFGPLLIGQGARETLNIVNTEHLPFSFTFEKASFFTGPGGGESVIKIEPSAGVVGPDSSLPIQVSFTPTLEKQFNFNVELRVRNKPQPLVLNVKGEGYGIHDTLHLGDTSGKLIEISQFSPTRLDFGMVHINDKVIRQLQITNSGRFNFDVGLTLKVPPGVRMPPVAITPELATVGRNQKLSCQLAYSPTSDAPLPQGLALVVQVTNGRSYTLQLAGRGKRPRLSFSFMKHDFGPCFVVTSKNGMKPAEATLSLVNEDDHEVYFDAAFDEVDFLTATVKQTTIAPGESVSVKLAFAPPRAGKFSTKLPFLINGLYMQSVSIYGDGCDMRLELCDPAQQQINLGAVALNQSASRSIGIVNRSRRPVDVSLGDAAEKLRARAVLLSFGGGGVDTTLRPREARQIELRFVPGGRIPPFSEPVIVGVCGIPRALLQISAACVAMDLQLEMEQLSFGQATLHSRIARPLMLQNRGDIPATWKIDKSMLMPDFSVSPLEGYLQPNEDTNIEVTFHPQQVNRDIRYENIPLYVDGQAPLSLTLTGMCVEAAAEAEPIIFKTQTRVAVQQKIPVKNPSTSPWVIKPVVQDDQWSGPEVLEVPPGQSVDYVVTYCPLTMTRDGEVHHGSVFFPLADGSAILYSLQGESEPPQPADTVSRSFASKHTQVVDLAVINWLKQPQRFRVDIRPAEGTDPSAQFSGHEHVDVPAGQAREYRLGFYAYREGTYHAEVHFINDKTGEYVYYKLALKAEAPGVLDSIALQAPLRQLTSHMLPVVNPLPTPATFTVAVNNAEVTVPTSLTVDAHSKSTLAIEWRPLLPKEATSQLSLQSPELGSYTYDLRLLALPAGETKTMQFKCALGATQSLRYRFRNFLRRAENYKLTLSTIDGSTPDFECDTMVAAAAAESSTGTEVAVDVTFEPSSLGTSEATLTISSAEGGEYVCELLGEPLPPRPQGPIVLKSGATAQVTFKNVFQQQAEFSFVSDSAAFTVAKPKEVVPPKKLVGVAVTFKPLADSPAGNKVSGKLTVSAPDGFTQLYYLQGEC